MGKPSPTRALRSSTYDTTHTACAYPGGPSCLAMACQQNDCSDPLNSKYYMVVLQYVSRLSAGKLTGAVMGLKPVKQRLPRGKFNLQVASEEVGLSLTGFPHNGVSPFGSSVEGMPVVVSEALLSLSPSFVWFGGGHPLLKLGISVKDLVSCHGNAFVADISTPRDNVINRVAV
ncbi:unnamed protein product [Choristocarpus tenellus]